MTPRAQGRSIVTRVLFPYVACISLFVLAVGFSVGALRQAATDSETLTDGLTPVALQLARLRATQETLATLLDGIPDERDPASARHVLSTLVSERTLMVADARAKCKRLEERVGSGRAATALLSDIDSFDDQVGRDPPLLDALFRALAIGDRDGINHTLVDLGAIEHDASKSLKRASDRISASISELAIEARKRERSSLYGLIGIAAGGLFVGILTLLHTRRILGPLAALTARARAVAEGDLMPRRVEARDDEIGSLESTFEEMVSKVGRERERAVVNERFAAIGKMAAHVTHEIRNPLSAMGLNLELLEEELTTHARSGDAEKRDGTGAREGSEALVVAIRREVERLERISEEYLRLARLPSPRLFTEDLSTWVKDALKFEEADLSKHGFVVALDVEEKLPSARFDEGQLRQALINLIRNARESMPGGGTIDVRVYATGMSVALSVGDRGPGMSEDVGDRVFEPFFSTKAEGTGLGLAITKQIILGHGGSIEWRPRDGGGTEFVISLPMAPRETPVHVAADEHAAPSGRPVV
ncbi:MAG: ATP-binding protein [Polyangiaceae bacterium]